MARVRYYNHSFLIYSYVLGIYQFIRDLFWKYPIKKANMKFIYIRILRIASFEVIK